MSRHQMFFWIYFWFASKKQDSIKCCLDRLHSWLTAHDGIRLESHWLLFSNPPTKASNCLEPTVIFVLKILWKLGVGVLFGHLSFSTKQSVGFQSWFSVNILIWIFKHLLHVLSNTVTVTTKGCILQKLSIYHFSSNSISWAHNSVS